MQKIKIIHVYKDFNVYNGLLEILTILAQEMDHDRFELGVCVYRYDGNEFGEKFENLGGKIFNLNIPLRVANEPREFVALFRFFKMYRPDVVQTHVLKANLYGTVAAKLAGVPVIIGTEMTLKDTAPTPLRRMRDMVIQPMVNFSIGLCDKFVVTSDYIREQWFSNDRSRKFETLYPPFNLEKYEAAQSTPSNSNRSGRTIGYVGRLSEEKGVEYLIRSMELICKEVPDVKLVIVGTGPKEEDFKELSRRLGLDRNIEFVGFKKNSFEMMKSFEVFVLPSRSEGCPIVVLEAMAMGVPVVATNVGGTPELLRNGETGILVPYNRPEDFSAAVCRLLKDAELATRMGAKGKELAFGSYHPVKFTERLQILYEDLTAAAR